ncbi:hypothetical protein [Flammeovirga aprica]|uniref:Uncharacterized protein n=1 Tax=Flammeovirga aprica JL-4 TaxID=694437 RepID=A0A7X9RZ62_9BACT|nr:hypothetical protein [Flammeovirga aprica]NME71393.1 hypothetical protein [Flammeovirga aprica JL-4]
MFIEVEVKLSVIVHGYDSDNKVIEETFEEEGFMKKILAVSRIQSISEKYILVTSSHGRIMYWEYKGSMEDLKQRLLHVGEVIA